MSSRTSDTNTLRIAGEQVLRPDVTVEDADVLIDYGEGTILNIGTDLDADADETLDAADCLVTPGLVNVHCHVVMTLLHDCTDDKPPDARLHEGIWPAENTLMPKDVRAGAKLGFVEMIKPGTTGFVDIYFHVPEIAAVVEEAGLRACFGHDVITLGRDNVSVRADIDESPDVTHGFDGATDGRIRTAAMPYSLTTVAKEYLHEFVADIHGEGILVRYRANGMTDEADPTVNERDEHSLSYARDLDTSTTDDFLTHGVHVSDAEIDLFADAGIDVVYCLTPNMKLASDMVPIQKPPDADVTVGLGTNGAASNNDPDTFDEMRDAAVLGKLAAEDASAITAPDMVRMTTVGFTIAADLPGDAFEVSGAADLAVVDLDAPHLTPVSDLVNHLAYAARGSDVRRAVCDGRVLMWDCEVLTLDEDAVMTHAYKVAALLRKRV